jgi:hypothetical protein
MSSHASETFTGEERRQILRDFRSAVNMTAAQLHAWLDTEESRRVGQKNGDRESVGHASGKRIADLLGRGKDDFNDEDLAHMRKVVGYIHRHLAQGPTKHDPATSDWRYSLMNWGHDPEKD